MLSPIQIKHYPIEPIHLSNSAGGIYQIAQSPPDDSQRTLGFMSSPEGLQKDQFIEQST
jgi:hypothetical protein